MVFYAVYVDTENERFTAIEHTVSAIRALKYVDYHIAQGVPRENIDIVATVVESEGMPYDELQEAANEEKLRHL